jgi:ribonuclease BN (tRNA processing enzyme)
VVHGADGETGPGLLAAARGADLLVAECSTPDEWAVAGHQSPTRVGELAAAARPGRVVLTHFYPLVAELDAAARVHELSGIPTVMAADDDRFVVPREDPAAHGKATR